MDMLITGMYETQNYLHNTSIKNKLTVTENFIMQHLMFILGYKSFEYELVSYCIVRKQKC